MARKATVDVDKVMQMLREGQSTQAVAEYFGVSRQAIDLHRHKFIQSGQLVDKRAPRKAEASPEATEIKVKSAPAASLDGLIELIIEAFDSLKKLPKLEAELEKYKRDFQKATAQIELLQKEVSKKQEQEARWRQAMSLRDGNSSS